MVDYRIKEAFPWIDEIEDPDLRAKVVEIWEDAVEASDYDDLFGVPWWPPYNERMPDSSLVSHCRDVIAIAVAIADALRHRHEGINIDRDVLLAGAVLHDVSKLFETSDGEVAPFNDLMPHPHYGAHLVATAGLSLDIQHIVIAHGNGSSIEPETIEALIVDAADGIAAHGMFWLHEGQLKPKKWR